MFFHGRGQPVLFSTAGERCTVPHTIWPVGRVSCTMVRCGQHAGLSNPEFSADLVLATVQDTLSESQTRCEARGSIGGVGSEVTSHIWLVPLHPSAI